MVSVWGLTDRGIVRRENQDSCAYEIIEDGDLAWGVVCDGMGGAKAGDIASKMAVETFCAHLEQLRDLEGPPPAADLLLAAAARFDAILPEPAPFVNVLEYRDSQIAYTLRVWVRTPDYWDVRFALLEAVGEEFASHGVEMSYPHMNVHIVEP